MAEIPNYAMQATHEPYTQHGLSMQSQQMRPQPEILQPMQSMQDPVGPCWEDINLSNINNIVGDTQMGPGVVPEFDFVSSFESTVAFHTDMSRVSGGILSTTKMSRQPFQWKQATFHHGPDK
jgi:hypothetical protein